MNEQIIYRYLDGIATEDEKQSLLEWLHQSPQNRYFFFEVQAIWKAKNCLTDQQQDLQITTSLQELNKKIERAESEKNSKKSFFEKRKTGAWISSAAVILLLVTFTLLKEKNSSLLSPSVETSLLTFRNLKTDSIKSILLDDGSVVWLGENSVLTYPAAFSGENRIVSLEGEAFFEVTSNPVVPFIVKTEVNQIKVLGTSFSVNTSFEDEKNEVILTSGTVQLQNTDGIGLVNLHPGQKALYSKESGTIEIDEVDLSLFSSWKYGLISLSNASIQTILDCLENTYHTPVLMDISSLENKKYHFSFKRSKGIEEALNQLSFMTGVPAQIKSTE